MEGKLYLEIFIRWAIATAILYVMQRIVDYFDRKKENFTKSEDNKKQKSDKKTEKPKTKTKKIKKIKNKKN